MVFAANAASEIAQEAVLYLREAGVVRDRQPLQAFGLEQLTKYVLENVYPVREAVEDVFGDSIGALRAATFKHPTLHPLFGFQRWKVGKCQEVFGLIMGALQHELLASLIVDDASHPVWKRSLLRITGRTRSNGVTLKHPTASEA